MATPGLTGSATTPAVGDTASGAVAQPGGGKVRCHNTEEARKLFDGVDWSPTGTGYPRAPRVVVKTAVDDKKLKAEKSREAFAEKQSVREKEFMMKFEVAKKEAERRLKEKQSAKERSFEERFKTFQDRNSELIHSVDGAIAADAAWRSRKQERLFNEWTTKVFQPMQDQINSNLASISDTEVEERRRQMFQSFLDESNRKTNGLFRDIIIESDYDPLAQQAATTMKYKKASIAEDPTKNRATRETGDRLASGLLKALPSDPRLKYKRNEVPVAQWATMDSTPHGRYNQILEGPAKKPGFNSSSVVLDHYKVLTGRDGKAQVQRETNARGKKMTGTMYESTVHECMADYKPPPKQPTTLPPIE